MASFLVHSTLRMVSTSMLFAYLTYYASATMVLQYMCNMYLMFGVVFACCGKDSETQSTEEGARKMIYALFTAVASIEAPICMVADAELNEWRLRTPGLPEKRFRRFLRWNTFTFAMNLSLTTLILGMVSDKVAAPGGPKFEMDTAMAEVSLTVLSATVVVSIALGIFAYHECTFVHGLQEPLNRTVKSASDRFSAVCGCCRSDVEVGVEDGETSPRNSRVATEVYEMDHTESVTV